MIDAQMHRDIANAIRRALPLSSLKIELDRSAALCATDIVVTCAICKNTVGVPRSGSLFGGRAALHVRDAMIEDVAGDPSLVLAAELLENLRAHPCGCTWTVRA